MSIQCCGLGSRASRETNYLGVPLPWKDYYSEMWNQAVELKLAGMLLASKPKYV